MKKLFIKLGLILGTVLIAGTIFIMPTVAGSGRDCDGNAVIYCGALTTTELTNAIEKGTGHAYQSPAYLRDLYGHYGIQTKDFGMLVEGRVTKDNKVYVGNKVVASGVYSMGRHYIPGSSQVSGFNYPLYIRHPEVSFNSNSIPAFVYMNQDGSMAYAVIKSCGNIVPGVGIRESKYLLTIKKYEDINGNGKKESNESYLSGWKFQVRGPEKDTYVTTNANGSIGVGNLKPGKYYIDEVMQPGWRAVNGTRQIIVLSKDSVVTFGNQKVKPLEVGLQIVKFNDIDADKIRDENEDFLSGWSFKVTGNGIEKTIVTDANGHTTLSGLKPGIYTVTEINQPGWENTTGLTIQKNVTIDPNTQTFMFGNRKVETPPVTPGGEIRILPITGSADMAGAMIASFALSGGTIAWMRSKRNLRSAIKQ